jgi:hypothetical protein
MKHVAKTTLTKMSGQLADEDLARVCGGFNPQPDPPVAIQGWDWCPAPPFRVADRFPGRAMRG